MASNNIQAAAATVQAVATVADNGFSLVNVASSIVQASTLYENIRTRMKRKVDELDKISRSVKDIFQIYWFSKKELNSWLMKVERIVGQVHALEDKISNAWMPHKLNEEMGVLCTEIDEVITKGKELRDAMVEREIKRVVKLATTVSIKNISYLMKQLNHTLENIRKKDISTIRVYGKVGTARREILEHLNNHIFENWDKNDMFDIVLWVPASDYKNYENKSARIQDIIAKRLGLNVGGHNDLNIIASKIQAELDGVKYLLLLDDVKDDIELQTIGIPKDTEGSKIVFTTSLPYLRLFGPFFPIEIMRLNNVDSWKMFEEILINNDSMQQHNIGIIAHKVVKWCDGIFSLIKVVAENFKSRTSESSWDAGLKMLRKSAEKGDIYLKAFENSLHLSYYDLEENQKRCFLFGALYPEGSKIPIDCLFDCWTALKLHKCDVKKESVYEILDHLVQKALLKKGSNKPYVKMNRLFRGAAIKILQQHETIKCLVAKKAFKELKRNLCKDTHWISLANGGIESQVLPSEVDCPKLRTLFLQKNSGLKDISGFFNSMGELTILDLHGTGIESIYPLFNINSLKVLYVNGCIRLGTVPFKIVGLGNLEVLDMRDTIINDQILDGVNKFKKLRRLVLSVNGDCDMSCLKVSQFSSLKEFIIDVKSNGDNKNKHSCMSYRNEIMTNTIEKIDNLKNLTTLQFQFKDETIDVIQVTGDTLKIFVPKQCNLKQVLHEREILSEALQVYIGFQMTANREIPTTFQEYDSFVLSCEKIVDDGVIENIFAKVKSLILIKNSSIKHLDHNWIPTRGMDHIENCLVQRCNKIETLMHCEGFLRLTTLVLSECFQLKVLFSNDLVHQGIKHLEIRDCTALEEINLSTNGGEDVFPNLMNLVLHELRMLKRICSVTKWPLLNALHIHQCGLLTELPLDMNSGVISIIVEKEWWENLPLSNEVKNKFEQCMEFGYMPVWP